MKFAIKTGIINFYLLFLHSNAFAGFQIEAYNYSNNPTVFSYLDLTYVPGDLLTKELHHGDKITLTNDKNLKIGKKYQLYFLDTHIPCSWVSVGAHGWGITLIVNNKEMGTICANKGSIFNFNTHSIVEFHSNYRGNHSIKFYNSGWWPNDSIFPTLLEISI